MEHDEARELLEGEQHRLEDVRTEAQPQQRENDFSILEQVEAELADVERALRRLDDGTYGTCEACGGTIGDDRLEAMPAARFCAEHEQQHEQQHQEQRVAEPADQPHAGARESG